MFLLCARFKTVRNSQGGSSERRFVIAVPGSGRRRDSVLEFFLILTARNPLKSPESDERIQENPSPFSWSGLVWIWFGLGEFGLRRSADGVGRSRPARASPCEWAKLSRTGMAGWQNSVFKRLKDLSRRQIRRRADRIASSPTAPARSPCGDAD